MENDKFDGEISDKVILLELEKFSTVLLLFLTKDDQQSFEFYRGAVKINGIAIAWHAFVVCDKESKLDAIKQPKGFRFLNCSWKKDEEIDSRAV